MFKKILASILAVMMLMSVMPISVAAASNYLTDENDVEWRQSGFYGWQFRDEDGDWQTFDADDYEDMYGDLPDTAYDEAGQEYSLVEPNYMNGTYYYSWTLSSSTSVLRDENGVVWHNVGGTWMFIRNSTAYPAESYSSVVDEDLPDTGTLNGVTYYFRNGTWTRTYSAYALTDSNGVDWGYYNGEWVWNYKDIVSGTASDYTSYLRANFPTYAYDEDENRYVWNGGWIRYSGSVINPDFPFYPGFDTIYPGIGGITGATGMLVEISRNIQWYTIGGDWYFTYGTTRYEAEDYYDLFDTWPSMAYAIDDEGNIVGQYVFDDDDLTWSAYYGSGSTIVPGLGTSGYVLYDVANNVQWTTYLGKWVFYYGSYTGDVDDYYDLFDEYPSVAYLRDENGDILAVYTFDEDDMTWETSGSIGGSYPGITYPGIGGITGNQGYGYECGAVANPNNVDAVYDYNGYRWVKNGTTWNSSYASKYSSANPAIYVDSTNRVWKMIEGKWLLDRYATVPTTPGIGTTTPSQTNTPNSATSLVDTYGNTWYKSNGSWTSSVAQTYYLQGITPTYEAPNGTLWILSGNTWVKKTTSTTTNDPNEMTSVTDTKGYKWTKSSGKWSTTSQAESYYERNALIPECKVASTTWYMVDGAWTKTKPAATVTDPNKLAKVDDAKGYAWTKSSSGKWTSSIDAATYYANTETYPQTKVGTTIWYLDLDKNVWTTTKPVKDIDPNTLSTVKTTAGSKTYTWTKIDGVWETSESVKEFYADNELNPIHKSAAGTTWYLNHETQTWTKTKPAKPYALPEEKVTDVFTDINANVWYADDVQFMYNWKTEEGTPVMGGQTTTTFGPGNTLNRAMLMVILARMAGADLSKYTTSEFDDVDFNNPNHAWFAAAVAWAVDKGITNGKGEIYDAEGKLLYKNGFAPDAAITRAEACTFLIRYAKQIKGNSIPTSYESLRFADADQVASWAQQSVSVCDRLGFIDENLITANKFNPNESITRAEVASLIAAYAQKYGK